MSSFQHHGRVLALLVPPVLLAGLWGGKLPVVTFAVGCMLTYIADIAGAVEGVLALWWVTNVGTAVTLVIGARHVLAMSGWNGPLILVTSLAFPLLGAYGTLQVRSFVEATQDLADILERIMLCLLPSPFVVTIAVALAPGVGPSLLGPLVGALYAAAYLLCAVPLEPSYPPQFLKAIPRTASPAEVLRRRSVVRPVDAAVHALAAVAVPAAVDFAVHYGASRTTLLEAVVAASTSACIAPLLVRVYLLASAHVAAAGDAPDLGIGYGAGGDGEPDAAAGGAGESAPSRSVSRVDAAVNKGFGLLWWMPGARVRAHGEIALLITALFMLTGAALHRVALPSLLPLLGGAAETPLRLLSAAATLAAPALVVGLLALPPSRRIPLFVAAGCAAITAIVAAFRSRASAMLPAVLFTAVGAVAFAEPTLTAITALSAIAVMADTGSSFLGNVRYVFPGTIRTTPQALMGTLQVAGMAHLAVPVALTLGNHQAADILLNGATLILNMAELIMLSLPVGSQDGIPVYPRYMILVTCGLSVALALAVRRRGGAPPASLLNAVYKLTFLLPAVPEAWLAPARAGAASTRVTDVAIEGLIVPAGALLAVGLLRKGDRGPMDAGKAALALLVVVALTLTVRESVVLPAVLLVAGLRPASDALALARVTQLVVAAAAAFLIQRRLLPHARAAARAANALLALALAVAAVRPSFDLPSIVHALHGTFVAPESSVARRAVQHADDLLWPSWVLLALLALAAAGVAGAPRLARRLVRRLAFAAAFSALLSLYASSQALPPDPLLYALHAPAFVAASLVIASAWPVPASVPASEAARIATPILYLVLLAAGPLAAWVGGAGGETGVELAATHAAAHAAVAVVLAAAHANRAADRAPRPRMGRAPTAADVLASAAQMGVIVPAMVGASAALAFALAVYIGRAEYGSPLVSACLAAPVLMWAAQPAAAIAGARRGAAGLPWRVRVSPALAAVVLVCLCEATVALSRGLTAWGGRRWRFEAPVAGFAPHSAWAWVAQGVGLGGAVPGTRGVGTPWNAPAHAEGVAWAVLLANSALACGCTLLAGIALANLVLPRAQRGGQGTLRTIMLALAPSALLAVVAGDLDAIRLLGAVSGVAALLGPRSSVATGPTMRRGAPKRRKEYL